MKNNTLITLAALLFCAFTSSLNAQLRSVNLFADYSSPLTKRFDIINISAVGGGAEISFDVKKLFTVSINGGYSIYSIAQEKAIEKWDWTFWNKRYKGVINLALDSSKNPALYGSSYPAPFQKMYVMPFFLTIGREIPLTSRISVHPKAGAGVIFYTRRLYIVEEWHKKIAGSEYDFHYSYRNFANDKVGNPFAVTGGIEGTYNLSESFQLYAAANYLTVLKTEGKYGYDNFPVDDALNFKFGLTILY